MKLTIAWKLQISLWESGGDSHHHFQKWWRQVTIVTYNVAPMCQAGNVLGVSERAPGPLSTCKVWCGSRESKMLLCVRLSVVLLCGKVWDSDFAQKALELRSGFDIVWQWKVLAQQRSTLSLHRYAAPPQDGEFDNAVMEHLPPKGDRLNRSGRNLTCKRTLCMGCAPMCEIWSWSTAGWVHKTPKTKNFVKSAVSLSSCYGMYRGRWF